MDDGVAAAAVLIHFEWLALVDHGLDRVDLVRGHRLHIQMVLSRVKDQITMVNVHLVLVDAFFAELSVSVNRAFLLNRIDK